MKFRRTSRFGRDFKNLDEPDKEYVENAFPEVSRALEGDINLRRKYRFKKMSGWEGIWEGHLKNLICVLLFIINTRGEKRCAFLGELALIAFTKIRKLTLGAYLIQKALI